MSGGWCLQKCVLGSVNVAGRGRERGPCGRSAGPYLVWAEPLPPVRPASLWRLAGRGPESPGAAAVRRRALHEHAFRHLLTLSPNYSLTQPLACLLARSLLPRAGAKIPPFLSSEAHQLKMRLRLPPDGKTRVIGRGRPATVQGGQRQERPKGPGEFVRAPDGRSLSPSTGAMRARSSLGLTDSSRKSARAGA